MQLAAGRNLRVHAMFLQSPCFLEPPPYPVTAYRFFDPLFRDAETDTNRRFGRVRRTKPEDNAQRENRKRLSGLEKRFNLLTQL